MSLLKRSFGSTKFGCPVTGGGGAEVAAAGAWDVEAMEVVDADDKEPSTCGVVVGGWEFPGNILDRD